MEPRASPSVPQRLQMERRGAPARHGTILQPPPPEMAIGTFAALQTIPAMLMLPFTGVIIDREDRRRLVMWLDAVRAIIILTVSILAFMGKAKVWELYLMNMLVAGGFWLFWPTIP